MSGLKDRVVIITGASAGIGASTAVDFAKVGAKVVLTARRRNKLEETAQKCIDVGLDKDKILILVGDIMQDEELKRIVESTVKTFGRLDVLVNNAGAVEAGSLTSASAEVMDGMYKMHVRAPYILMKHALPHLIESKGNVVNVSSITSLRALPYSLPYSIAKCAQDQLTKGASIELGPKGVRVNSVCPGAILTEVFSRSDLVDQTYIEKYLEELAVTHPLMRNGQPEEVAKVIVFLASDDASFVSGVNMSVDGAKAQTSWMPASKMAQLQN